MKSLSLCAAAGCALLFAGCTTEVQRQGGARSGLGAYYGSETAYCQDAEMKDLPQCKAIQEKYEQQ